VLGLLDFKARHCLSTPRRDGFERRVFGIYFCMSPQTAARFAATCNWVALFEKGGDQPA
jgi:hypothetical protein